MRLLLAFALVWTSLAQHACEDTVAKPLRFTCGELEEAYGFKPLHYGGRSVLCNTHWGQPDGSCYCMCGRDVGTEEKVGMDKTLKFSITDLWVRDNKDGTATVGMSEHYQGVIGDILTLDLPNLNKKVSVDDDFAHIYAVEESPYLWSPVTGEIIEINEKLEDEPWIINEDPYGAGWIVKIRLSDASELNGMRDAEEYAKFLKENPLGVSKENAVLRARNKALRKALRGLQAHRGEQAVGTNQNQLINNIESRAGISAGDAANALQATVDVITNTVAAGNSVIIEGFGSFSRKERKARVGRNPKTGARMDIPKMNVPEFSADKAFKDALKNAERAVGNDQCAHINDNNKEYSCNPYYKNLVKCDICQDDNSGAVDNSAINDAIHNRRQHTGPRYTGCVPIDYIPWEQVVTIGTIDLNIGLVPGECRKECQNAGFAHFGLLTNDFGECFCGKSELDLDESDVSTEFRDCIDSGESLVIFTTSEFVQYEDSSKQSDVCVDLCASGEAGSLCTCDTQPPAKSLTMGPEQAVGMSTDKFVDSIASGANISTEQAENALQAIVETIKDGVARGEPVTIEGLGSWKKQTKSGYVFRNPRDGSEVQVPPQEIPNFSAATAFKDAVAGGTETSLASHNQRLAQVNKALREALQSLQN